MSKYYYLIAGLPNISFDDSKLPYSVSEFKEELVNHLTKDDARLLEFFSLQIDNKNLLEQIQNPDYDPEEGGRITYDELNVLFEGLKNEKAKKLNEDGEEEEYDEENPPKIKPFKNKNKRFPAYFETFARAYFESLENEEETVVPWEDRLSALYYEYAMKSKNAFIASWFELNLNISNIFTALTCRKYKLDRATYIVGDTWTSNQLRTSNARDFELSESLEYLPSVARIAEEADLLQRERKTDFLKWEWIDDQIFVKALDFESVLAYFLKLEILERWTNLDKATGEKTFRQLVEAMKKGSEYTLEEFKRNNKK